MLRIQKKALEAMVADAVTTFPDECCGFLFGSENDGERIISGSTVVQNAKEGDKRRRFEITPKDYLSAERHADERGLQLIGVYHSHPNHPAIPSEQDRVAAQPYFSYIIISVSDKKVDHIRSWQLTDESMFEEEKIESEPKN